MGTQSQPVLTNQFVEVTALTFTKEESILRWVKHYKSLLTKNEPISQKDCDDFVQMRDNALSTMVDQFTTARERQKTRKSLNEETKELEQFKNQAKTKIQSALHNILKQHIKIVTSDYGKVKQQWHLDKKVAEEGDYLNYTPELEEQVVYAAKLQFSMSHDPAYNFITRVIALPRGTSLNEARNQEGEKARAEFLKEKESVRMRYIEILEKDEKALSALLTKESDKVTAYRASMAPNDKKITDLTALFAEKVKAVEEAIALKKGTPAEPPEAPTGGDVPDAPDFDAPPPPPPKPAGEDIAAKIARVFKYDAYTGAKTNEAVKANLDSLADKLRDGMFIRAQLAEHVLQQEQCILHLNEQIQALEALRAQFDKPNPGPGTAPPEPEPDLDTGGAPPPPSPPPGDVPDVPPPPTGAPPAPRPPVGPRPAGPGTDAAETEEQKKARLEAEAADRERQEREARRKIIADEDNSDDDDDDDDLFDFDSEPKASKPVVITEEEQQAAFSKYPATATAKLIAFEVPHIPEMETDVCTAEFVRVQAEVVTLLKLPEPKPVEPKPAAPKPAADPKPADPKSAGPAAPAPKAPLNPDQRLKLEGDFAALCKTDSILRRTLEMSGLTASTREKQNICAINRFYKTKMADLFTKNFSVEATERYERALDSFYASSLAICLSRKPDDEQKTALEAKARESFPARHTGRRILLDALLMIAGLFVVSLCVGIGRVLAGHCWFFGSEPSQRELDLKKVLENETTLSPSR